MTNASCDVVIAIVNYQQTAQFVEETNSPPYYASYNERRIGCYHIHHAHNASLLVAEQ